MQIYHAEWKLVSRIDLSLFVDEFKHMELIFENVKNACINIQSYFNASDKQINCIHIVDQIKVMLDDAKEYSSKWFIDDTELNMRKKRGLFDGFGYGLKMFTGNQKHQEFIIKKQTLIIKTSLEYIEEEMSSMKNQTNAIEADVWEVNNILLSINQSFSFSIDRQKTILALHNKLHSLIDYFSLLIMQFERKQSMFLEAVAITQKNPSSPVLIPPEIFRNELNRIASYTGTINLELPCGVTPENLANFETRIYNHQ